MVLDNQKLRGVIYKCWLEHSKNKIITILFQVILPLMVILVTEKVHQYFATDSPEYSSIITSISLMVIYSFPFTVMVKRLTTEKNLK